MQSKEKVREAIVNRLQTKSGLDLKSLDVTTTSVSFDKNMAYATVAFHPKNDPAVNSGMVMKYTLEQRDGKWVVLSVGDSQGRDLRSHGGQGAGLPPGHPSLGNPTAGSPNAGSPNAGSMESQGANGQAR